MEENISLFQESLQGLTVEETKENDNMSNERCRVMSDDESDLNQEQYISPEMKTIKAFGTPEGSTWCTTCCIFLNHYSLLLNGEGRNHAGQVTGLSKKSFQRNSNQQNPFIY